MSIDPKAESKAIGAYLSSSFTDHGPELHAKLMQHALRCDRCREMVREKLRVVHHQSEDRHDV